MPFPESNTATKSKAIEGQFVALIEYYNIFALGSNCSVVLLNMPLGL